LYVLQISEECFDITSIYNKPTLYQFFELLPKVTLSKMVRRIVLLVHLKRCFLLLLFSLLFVYHKSWLNFDLKTEVLVDKKVNYYQLEKSPVINASREKMAKFDAKISGNDFGNPSENEDWHIAANMLKDSFERQLKKLQDEGHPLENSCKYPVLIPEDPSIRGYVKHGKKLQCKKVMFCSKKSC